MSMYCDTCDDEALMCLCDLIMNADNHVIFNCV